MSADKLSDLVASSSGAIVAGITYSKHAVLIDIPSREAIGRIALLADTDTRISFDGGLDRFILGSWKKGIQCLELKTGKTIWQKSRCGYTYAEIIDFSREVYVTGLKEGSGCLIFDLETGEETRKISDCSDFLAKDHIKLGYNPFKETLLIYDEKWNALGSPKWKSFALWDFACDDDGIIIVSGPDGYAASFIAKDGQPIAELSPKVQFGRLECIAWSRRQNIFFAVASECNFSGYKGRALIRLDHTLRSFKIVKQLPPPYDDVFCDSRYLVRMNGEIFDLDEQKELSPIEWDKIINQPK